MALYEGSQELQILAMEIHELSALALLHRIAHWNGDSLKEISQVLAAAFGAEDYPDCIRDLDGRDIDPRLYISGLDQVSSCSIPACQTQFNDSVVDHRHPSAQFRCLENLHPGINKDLHLLQVAPCLLHDHFTAQQTSLTAVRIREVWSSLEAHQ